MGRILRFGGLLVCWLGLAANVPAEPGKTGPDVVVFTIDHCPDCLHAKQYLAERRIDYREFNIERSAKAKEVFERLGGRGVPFLLIDGERMQGFQPERFETKVFETKRGQ